MGAQNKKDVQKRRVKLNPPEVEDELIRTSEEHCDLPAIAAWEKKTKKRPKAIDRKTHKKHLDEGPGLV